MFRGGFFPAVQRNNFFWYTRQDPGLGRELLAEHEPGSPYSFIARGLRRTLLSAPLSRFCSTSFFISSFSGPPAYRLFALSPSHPPSQVTLSLMDAPRQRPRLLTAIAETCGWPIYGRQQKHTASLHNRAPPIELPLCVYPLFDDAMIN